MRSYYQEAEKIITKKMMVGSMKLIYLHKRVKLVEATEFWMGNISSDSVYTAIL